MSRCAFRIFHRIPGRFHLAQRLAHSSSRSFINDVRPCCVRTPRGLLPCVLTTSRQSSLFIDNFHAIWLVFSDENRLLDVATFTRATLDRPKHFRRIILMTMIAITIGLLTRNYIYYRLHHVKRPILTNFPHNRLIILSASPDSPPSR